MKRSRFSEEQIIGILKEHQAGITATDLCRKHGISDATFYTWRKKYGGMEVSDAKRLKSLGEENAKLKKLLAEQMMDVSTLRETLTKTSDARFKEESRELGNRDEGLFAAPRLCPGRHGAACLPLPVEQAGRCRPAIALAGAIVGAAALRLGRHAKHAGRHKCDHCS